MAQQPTRRRLKKLYGQLDHDDRQKVIKFMNRLSGKTAKGGRESLNDSDDTGLSYVDAADSDEYNRLKKAKREQSWG